MLAFSLKKFTPKCVHIKTIRHSIKLKKGPATPIKIFFNEIKLPLPIFLL